ncbi:MAG: arginine repressor [Pseudopedobacter sp.]|nr:arginine repressor [Deinococcales bacterium]
MLSKEQRQKLIQDIIAREPIGTQSELVGRLQAQGVQVTQATVSRDVSELRLVRLPIGRGRHRYALSQVSSEVDVMDELGRLFRTLVRDLDRAENLIIIKTVDGHAIGIAYLLDKLRRDDLVGTLAGQDTIFIAARTTLEAEGLLEELSSLSLV